MRVHVLGRWFMASVIMGSCACGPAYHASRLREAALRKERIPDIRALGRWYRSDLATRALIGALGDPDPAIRFFAAEALETHLSVGMKAATRVECVRALVRLLDDREFGRYTIWIIPLVPVGGSAKTGSVRSRALLTLTETHGIDLGLDRKAWEQRLEEFWERRGLLAEE